MIRPPASYDPEGLIQRAVRAIKAEHPGLCVQTDIALDPYTEHGHDGLVVGEEIVNDPTIKVLCKMAVSHAEARRPTGVAPSDMMDGRVGAIRNALDAAGHENVAILAYSAKICLYILRPIPWRSRFSAQARRQKDLSNESRQSKKRALYEIALDIEEGADVVMVKPALAYLDVIAAAREHFDVPLAAYNVSGEYAMIKAAAEKGWIDETNAMMEMLGSIKRAGADMILTYFALGLC